ncbi:hypothetical protein MJO28_006770 [Puccinia striiformis f. sp. tritici]|uniref:Transcription elongation factor n=2 Tax=Puccinia striiformis f. sp. tritici TaxID=168172 RepID=A0A0L0VLK6_9BASI|nr:hypothetical protein MJO28_006770 [Puccinia striiformis f. sp. tritici]KNF00092.1 transcription elongation factor S-II [Puccinia striiformis f. sp. tritici PST-78]
MATTTGSTNRSAFETANSLKKQLVSSISASNDKEIKECLERIKKEIVPSEELIRATKIGISVGKQRQNSNPEIAKIAKSIINHWKHHMKKEPSASTTQKNGNTTTPSSNTQKSPSLSSSQHSNLKSPKPDPSISKLPTTSPGVKATSTSTGLPSSSSSGTTTNTPGTSQLPKTTAQSPPPASTTSTANGVNKIKRNGPRSSKTEDPNLNFELYKDEKVRNGSLKAVFDALIFDSDAPADLIYDRAIAIELEVDKKNDSTGYKNKMRSLIFNLRDKNNPGLRESVVSGEISASKLCVMGPQDMASEERKSQDRKLAEENLFKARGAGPQQAETDAFRCARCGQRKCTYYQMQTRSADEPMTTFVTCVNCNCRWKFS